MARRTDHETAAIGSRRGLSDLGELRPSLAATLVVVSLFLLAGQDTLVKLTSDDVSMWQFQILRAATHLAIFLMLARWMWGATRPVPKRWWAVALRSLMLVGAMVFFFGGIPFLNLGEIAAGLYVYPLFVAVFSAVIFGDRVGPRRVLAIAVGFSGALLILKPGTDAFQWAALMPVTAAVFYGATILITRKLCREENPATLVLGVSLTFCAVGVVGVVVAPLVASDAMVESWPYLATGWRPLAMTVALMIAAAATLNMVANIGLAKAYQSADPSWLAPFDYTYLIFATLFAAAVWGDWPDPWSVLGMSMIAVSGAYVAWRERRESQIHRVNMNKPLR